MRGLWIQLFFLCLFGLEGRRDRTSHRHANSIQISLGQHDLLKAHFMLEKTEIGETKENVLTAPITHLYSNYRVFIQCAFLWNLLSLWVLGVNWRSLDLLKGDCERRRWMRRSWRTSYYSECFVHSTSVWWRLEQKRGKKKQGKKKEGKKEDWCEI